MKVLILGDGQGWIVDRINKRMAQDIPCEFTIDYYTSISPQKLIECSESHDLIHYGNWDIQRHYDILGELKAPLLLSIRSHRYYPLVKEAVKKVACVHVINKRLQEEFPGSVYIPDGIFDWFKPDHEFVVGWAGHPDRYKGYQLIEQACHELGVTFSPARGSIPPENMPDYYKGIDLYVCASVAEGASTPVLECMAMNIPVITTDVGFPSSLNIIKVEQTVQSIKEGILKFYTRPQVWPELSWENINRRFYELYQRLTCAELDNSQ